MPFPEPSAIATVMGQRLGPSWRGIKGIEIPKAAEKAYIEAMIANNLLRRKMRTLLTTLGIAVGVAAVVTLGVLLNLHPALAGFVRLRYSADLLVQALGTALVLGVVGGLYPAWRAARLQPVEALRYE